MMGHANCNMLIDNTHTVLSGHPSVHLLTPKRVLLLISTQMYCLHTPNFKCSDADMGEKKKKKLSVTVYHRFTN